jgi:hypothetical protein
MAMLNNQRVYYHDPSADLHTSNPPASFIRRILGGACYGLRQKLSILRQRNEVFMAVSHVDDGIK